MSTAKKYRKKPVVIEAMEFVGGLNSAAPILNWALDGGCKITYRPTVTEQRVRGGELARSADAEHLRIRTLEGTMRADIGDFIIMGVEGEFYPCKPKIFAETYDEVV